MHITHSIRPPVSHVIRSAEFKHWSIFNISMDNKMKFLKIFMAFIFIATSSVSVGAQQLWNGSTYGMSEGAIKSMFPKVVVAKNKNPYGSNATPVYDLNDIDLEGDKFTATFFFKDGKLTQVRLSPSGIEEIDWILYKAKRLEEILTHKYGTPYKSNDQSQGEILKFKEAHWKNEKTEIMLIASEITPSANINNQPVASKRAILAIIYMADFIDAASKL